MVSQDVPDGIVAVPPEADQPRAEVVGHKALIGAEIAAAWVRPFKTL